VFAPIRKQQRILIFLLVAADLLTIPVSLLLTWHLRTDPLRAVLPLFAHSLKTYLQTIPVLSIMWVASWWSAGMYSISIQQSAFSGLTRRVRAVFYLAVSIMATSYLVKMDYSRIMVLFFLVISIPVNLIFRWLLEKLAGVIAPFKQSPSTLIIGSGEFAERVISSLGRLPEPRHRIKGVLTEQDSATEEIGGVEVIGCANDLPRLVVTDLFEIASGIGDLNSLSRMPVVEIGSAEKGGFYSFVKRLLDLLVSISLIVVFSPLMGIVWSILLISEKGSPVFKQTRIGRHGIPFTLFKFRTMKPEADEYEVAPVKQSDPRITGVGKFLRKSSLDELPQLFNVLRGSMSMVGPRPEMDFIVKEYNTWQKRRLEVKPGITGLWQIMGRKDLPLHENLEYDFYYMRNQSLMLDMAILARTVVTVLKGRGAY